MPCRLPVNPYVAHANGAALDDELLSATRFLEIIGRGGVQDVRKVMQVKGGRRVCPCCPG